MERLEATFIKNFANGNRRKGKKSLKPGQKKREKHRTTFFLGMQTLSWIKFFVCDWLVKAGDTFTCRAIHRLLDCNCYGHCRLNAWPGSSQSPGKRSVHGEHIPTLQVHNISISPSTFLCNREAFPSFFYHHRCSLFGFIVLHLLMYGSNTFLWRRFQVNYPSIFGFKPDTELGFRQVFLLASGLSVLSLAAVVSNLDMEMDPSTLKYSTLTELVPLALVIVRFLNKQTYYIYIQIHKDFLPNYGAISAAGACSNLLPLQHTLPLEPFPLHPLFMALCLCPSSQGSRKSTEIFQTNFFSWSHLFSFL